MSDHLLKKKKVIEKQNFAEIAPDNLKSLDRNTTFQEVLKKRITFLYPSRERLLLQIMRPS